MTRLNGDVAIVNGAAHGIGAAYARGMAAEGARVVIADVLESDKLVAEIEGAGGVALGMVCDITAEALVAALVAKTLAEFGQIDILVNNAALFGDLKHTPFEDLGEDEWDAVMRVNVRGMWQVGKAVVPEMRKRQYGKIVNISSTTALKGTPIMLHYVSSKGAVVAMSRAMAREVGDDNICVDTIAPGLTIRENVLEKGNWSEEWLERNKESRTLKRLELPEDLVGTVIFLSSREADFITGQLLAVDGAAGAH